MRIDVKKYLFVGHRGSLEAFFEKAQQSALIHFIDTSQIKIKEVPVDIQNVIFAIKILKEFPLLQQEEPENSSNTDSIVNNVLNLKHSIDNLFAERRTLNLEKARISVFGQFSLGDIKAIEQEGHLAIQFFVAKKGVKEEKEPIDGLVYVNSEHGLDYFIAINKEPVQYENMIEMRFDHEYNSLKNRITQIDSEIAEKETKLKTFTKYDTFLHHALVKKYNAFSLQTAKTFSQELVDGALFVVEGWVPADKVLDLTHMIQDQNVQMMEIAIEEGDKIPTYLENKGLNRVGEDLVHIYDTPSNTDKDPSLWVLFSFAIFFAMIINDAGYGLLFLTAALFFRYKKSALRNTGLRVWKLAIMLCSFCVVWGVLMNSFFGLNIEAGHGLRQVSALNWLVEQKAAYHFSRKDAIYDEWVKEYPEIADAETPIEFLHGAKNEDKGTVTFSMINKFSDSILMELALLVGVIHISLSFLRYIRKNWAGIGWIIAIWGAYFYFPLLLNATTLFVYALGFNKEALAATGLQLMYIGLGLAVFLGILKNKWLGLLEITNGIQIFADILSYLRLYALGLAGAIISATLNDIAGSLFFLGGVALLIIGHGINMALAIVGGTIHGLRLNFIEWYHYSFEGGGRMFNPLRKIEIE